jgi:hypothetical protein
MKKWHVEGILYLNDSGKRRLALPDAQQLSWHAVNPGEPKKDSLLLRSFRWIAGLILKTF